MAVKRTKNKLGNNPLQTATQGEPQAACSAQVTAELLLSQPPVEELPGASAKEGLDAAATTFLTEGLQDITGKLAKILNSQYAVRGVAEKLALSHGLTKEAGAIRAALAQERAALGEIEKISLRCLVRLGEETAQTTGVNEELLSVSAGDQVFLAPVRDIVEVFRLTGADEAGWGGKRVVCRRGEILPLFCLEELLDTSGRARDPTVKSAEYGLVVTGNGKMILAVDALLGRGDAVVRPLPQGLEFVRGISGAATLDNGKIALVLDVPELFKLAAKPGQQ